MDQRPKPAMLTRPDAAAEAGCHAETIRYYERIGLMPRPARNSVGHRLYDKAALRRLRFILRARRLEFSTEEIAALLHYADKPDHHCKDVEKLARHRLHEVRQRLDDLRQMERDLVRLTSHCACSGPDACPVIDALQSAAPPVGSDPSAALS